MDQSSKSQATDLTFSMAENVIGLDEVGRGPWAGPLVVGAVILGAEFRNLPEYAELTDSKRLSAGKREKLALCINNHALATGLGWVTAKEIDEKGLGASLRLACRRAVKQVLSKGIPFERVVIDGTINLLAGTPLEDRVQTLPKADLLVKEVSAASIIAKVARDQYMKDLDQKYPGYDFSHHVGYGTAAHQEALRNLGPCPEHRLSFKPLKNYAPKVATNVIFGQKAENITLKYLEKSGHQIIAHNFRTKTYEIDIISQKNDKIYFTEVKSRQSNAQGKAIEQITPSKHQKMTYGAETFLASHPQYAHLQPLLAAASVYQEVLEDWFILEA